VVTLADQLTVLIAEAVRAAGLSTEVPLEACVPAADPKHGDYQSNQAFRLGKATKTNPRAVASTLLAHLPASPLVESVDIAGPGFLNFKLSDSGIAADLLARVNAPRLGAPPVGEGRTLVIDYSSPNIAKRMHVGHLRSTIIGDALARMHRWLGWRVVADNHIGDWGTQFGKLIVAWRGWRDDAAYEADPIGELQRIYQEFGDRAAADGSLLDRARQETVRLQEGDPENRALWEEFCRVSMAEFDQVYRRLGVRFDVVLGESFYRDGLQDLVEDLLARGIAEHDDGAVIIRLSEADGKGLGNAPLLIRKSDGAALYGTTDLATVLYRETTWGPDRVVYETDVRQALHFRQIFAVARKLGVQTEFVHVGHGMLRLDGDVVSTRKGGGGETRSLNLVDVLDTAVARARAVVDEQSAELPETERGSIAEAVGVAAIKYADLSQHPASDIHFDWDRMMAMDGNTAPYLLYANARCHSLFRRSGKGALVEWAPSTIVLNHETERALALLISRTPEVVLDATDTARPNLIAEHGFGLAKALARFYRECRVLDPDLDPAVTASRLTLVRATSRALETCLDLLGMPTLTRM
jgi:arginyl-tRNA synthetase